jgi:hypothetical protein
LLPRKELPQTILFSNTRAIDSQNLSSDHRLGGALYYILQFPAICWPGFFSEIGKPQVNYGSF